MRISMLQTTPGSVDGVRVADYMAGTEYDLTATDGERDLAAAFVGAGLAVDLDAKPVAPEPAAQEATEPARKPGRQKNK